MTETAPLGCADLPSPAAALEARFARILQTRMHDLPMVNPALEVRAVGFRHWGEHWLGVLVTPWFMNLVLTPRVVGRWHAIPERETRHFVFPAGVFEFIGARDTELGSYLACSLFSPMFEFADAPAAQATAAAALEALFDAADRQDGDAPAALPTPAGPRRAAVEADAISKRGFLFGKTPRADRGT